MESQQRRSRPVPGIRPHILELKSITDGINAISQKISECNDRIVEESKKSNEKSAMLSIRLEIKELGSKIKLEKEKRNKMKEELSKLKERFSELKRVVSTDKKKSNYSTEEDLVIQERDLEYRLMTTKVTAHQEKEIGNMLANIKKKRQDIRALGSKETKMAAVLKSLNDLTAQIKTITTEINTKEVKIKERKKELAKLAEMSKVKSPVVVELEREIQELKSQKNDLYTRRKAERAEIARKEELHRQRMEELVQQKRTENKRREHMAKIREMDDARNSLVNEKSKWGADKFDNLASVLGALRAHEKLSLSVDTVLSLREFNVPIPQRGSDIDDTVAALSKVKDEFKASSVKKIVDIDEKIKDLDMKIVAERKALDSIPKTEAHASRKARGGAVRSGAGGRSG